MSLHLYKQLQQGTEEWLAARRGIVTASVVGKLLTVGAPGPRSYGCPDCLSPADEPCVSRNRKTPTPIQTMHPGRVATAAEQAKDAPPVIEVADNETSRAVTAILVTERLSGFTEDLPMTSDMWRGVESEPIAREVYADHSPHDVAEVGFMVRDDWGYRIGYSPDGLVGEDGLLEVKSPRAKTHVLTILADEVPAHYMAQLQTGLLVSGRKWIDFVSYVGGLPLWTKRVHPDPAWHRAIVAAVAAFETTAEQMTDRYLKAVEGLPKTERLAQLSDLEVI